MQGELKMKKLIVFYALFILSLFSAAECSTDFENENNQRDTLYLLLRAQDCEGNSALFVSTDHAFPWERFPEKLKKFILSKKIAVVEVLYNEMNPNNEMNPKILQEFFSRNFLPSEAFVASKEVSWSFLHDHEKYQRLYTNIHLILSKNESIDYSYLNNISLIKQGLLAFMNITFFQSFSFNTHLD